MLRELFAALAAASALTVAAAGGAAAQSNSLGLAAGPHGSASARLATDISAALSAAGFLLRPEPVPGAFGPLMAARHSPDVQLAIVSGDAPAFLAARASLDDAGRVPPGADMAMVMALEARPVHLLVRGNQRGIEDLGGARIGIGPVDQPGAVTAALLLDAARVRPAEIETGPLEIAVAGLLAGRLDAVFLTGPAPDPLLARAIDFADGVRLLPLSPATGIAGHEPAEIAAGSYRFDISAVPTVAVRGALVAYLYTGATCAQITGVSEALGTSLDMLNRHGDPMWASVSPGAATGFAPHPCTGLAHAPAAAPASAEAALAVPAAGAAEEVAAPLPPSPAAPAAGEDAASAEGAPAGPTDEEAAEAGRQLLKSIGSIFGGSSE